MLPNKPDNQGDTGASLRDRATQASPQAPAGLGHPVSIPSAGGIREVWAAASAIMQVDGNIRLTLAGGSSRAEAIGNVMAKVKSGEVLYAQLATQVANAREIGIGNESEVPEGAAPTPEALSRERGE